MSPRPSRCRSVPPLLTAGEWEPEESRTRAQSMDREVVVAASVSSGGDSPRSCGSAATTASAVPENASEAVEANAGNAELLFRLLHRPDTGQTTVMVKNIQRNCSHAVLLKLFKELGFDRCIDLLYLPMETRKLTNSGYVFVNLTSEIQATMFKRRLAGCEFHHDGCTTTLATSMARIQGFVANVAALRARGAMSSRVPAECRPLLVDPDTGREEVFPSLSKASKGDTGWQWRVWRHAALVRRLRAAVGKVVDEVAAAKIVDTTLQACGAWASAESWDKSWDALANLVISAEADPKVVRELAWYSGVQVECDGLGRKETSQIAAPPVSKPTAVISASEEGQASSIDFFILGERFHIALCGMVDSATARLIVQGALLAYEGSGNWSEFQGMVTAVENDQRRLAAVVESALAQLASQPMQARPPCLRRDFRDLSKRFLAAISKDLDDYSARLVCDRGLEEYRDRAAWPALEDLVVGVERDEAWKRQLVSRVVKELVHTGDLGPYALHGRR
mmetsp:Transcript_52977/g.140850  ORF Transcript_52977/g.140850 Transcript_52977/m.140850 type:complete len:508 (-) Transcript_52977:407-1930(-)